MSKQIVYHFETPATHQAHADALRGIPLPPSESTRKKQVVEVLSREQDVSIEVHFPSLLLFSLLFSLFYTNFHQDLTYHKHTLKYHYQTLFFSFTFHFNFFMRILHPFLHA